MGKKLVAKLTPILEKITWPQNQNASLQGKQTFEVAIEKIESATHNPEAYLAALRILQTGDSRPYAYAGVAYVLVLAANKGRLSYDQAGLNQALTWLGVAQDDEPDILEINAIEALIYIYLGRFEDARKILDYLHRQDPYNFDLIKIEIAYWRQNKDIEQTIEWFERGLKAANSVPQRLRLRHEMGDFFLEVDRPEEALAIYKEAVHFDKQNAQIWHRMSVASWQLKDFEEAKRYNMQALRLQDFPAARKMEAELRKKLGPTGLLNRLFGA